MKSGFRIIVAVAMGFILTVPQALAARFVDMNSNWAQRYVNDLSDQGIIGAEPDGKFHPEQPITRAVLCAWLVKVLGIDNQPVPPKSSYPDVKTTDWFYKAVEIARQSNYISGFSDGFRPQQYIQKGDLVTILTRALGGPAPDEDTISDTLKQFKDADKIPTWSRSGIAKAAADKVLVNYPDPQTVGATQIATRAEAAASLFKLYQFLTHQDINDAVKQAEQPSPPVQAAAPPAACSSGMETPSTDNSSDDSGCSSPAPPTYVQPPAACSPAAPSYAQPPAASSPAAPSYAQPPAASAPSAPSYSQSPASAAPTYAQTPAAPPQTTTFSQGSAAPPGSYLQGGVGTTQVLGVGTHFRAKLVNSLDSTTNNVGDEFHAQVTEPVFVNGSEAVPVGSTLIGEITNIVSPKNGNFGKDATIDVKFTAIETPDGRKFTIDASIDAKALAKAAGNDQSRTSKTLHHAGKDALIGGGIGAGTGLVYSLMRGGRLLGPNTLRRTAVMGGVGAVAGAGYGVASSAVHKGSEVKVPAGLILPIQLDSALTMNSNPPPAVQAQPSAYSPPPQYSSTVQTPYGYVPPQQAPAAPPGYPSYSAPPSYQGYPPAQTPPAAPPGYPSYPPPSAAPAAPSGYPAYPPPSTAPAAPQGYPSYPAPTGYGAPQPQYNGH